MKERINTAIKYLKQVSFAEPRNIRVEEIANGGSIVLSFSTKDSPYAWDVREYKHFTFFSTGDNSQVASMRCFDPITKITK